MQGNGTDTSAFSKLTDMEIAILHAGMPAHASAAEFEALLRNEQGIRYANELTNIMRCKHQKSVNLGSMVRAEHLNISRKRMTPHTYGPMPSQYDCEREQEDGETAVIDDNCVYDKSFDNQIGRGRACNGVPSSALKTGRRIGDKRAAAKAKRAAQLLCDVNMPKQLVVSFDVISSAIGTPTTECGMDELHHLHSGISKLVETDIMRRASVQQLTTNPSLRGKRWSRMWTPHKVFCESKKYFYKLFAGVPGHISEWPHMHDVLKTASGFCARGVDPCFVTTNIAIAYLSNVALRITLPDHDEMCSFIASEFCRFVSKFHRYNNIDCYVQGTLEIIVCGFVAALSNGVECGGVLCVQPAPFFTGVVLDINGHEHGTHPYISAPRNTYDVNVAFFNKGLDAIRTTYEYIVDNGLDVETFVFGAEESNSWYELVVNDIGRQTDAL